MSWTNIIKNRVSYSGTCPKCKQFVSGGSPCPNKLPADKETSPGVVLEGCPMKINEPDMYLEESK